VSEETILQIASAYAQPQIEQLLIARIVKETVALFLQTYRAIESAAS
jgi:hypothetical protein